MTSRRTDLVITALGALTPVGANAEQSCAAIRAGITRITESPIYLCTPMDPEWDAELPLFWSNVPAINTFAEGYDRFIELTIPALTEMLEAANLRRGDLQKTALYLALPRADPATESLELPARLPSDLGKRTGLRFRAIEFNEEGHTGVFSHISTAIDLLESGELEYCVVGGVDSYLIEERLGRLDAEWRIKSERNIDGFIPGEASVMLMLETAAHAKARGAKALSKITAIASGEEPETIASRKHSTGSGLTNAISGVLQQTGPDTRFGSVYCSLNGESYFAFEWGLQLPRLDPAFENMSQLVHPTENCGDIGAATGGLLLACATKAFEHAYNYGDTALLWTSGDTRQRMAITLQSGDY